MALAVQHKEERALVSARSNRKYGTISASSSIRKPVAHSGSQSIVINLDPRLRQCQRSLRVYLSLLPPHGSLDCLSLLDIHNHLCMIISIIYYDPMRYRISQYFAILRARSLLSQTHRCPTVPDVVLPTQQMLGTLTDTCISGANMSTVAALSRDHLA